MRAGGAPSMMYAGCAMYMRALRARMLQARMPRGCHDAAAASLMMPLLYSCRAIYFIIRFALFYLFILFIFLFHSSRHLCC